MSSRAIVARDRDREYGAHIVDARRTGATAPYSFFRSLAARKRGTKPINYLCPSVPRGSVPSRSLVATTAALPFRLAPSGVRAATRTCRSLAPSSFRRFSACTRCVGSIRHAIRGGTAGRTSLSCFVGRPPKKRIFPRRTGEPDSSEGARERDRSQQRGG